jgi:CheY-like chemotaxis protein
MHYVLVVGDDEEDIAFLEQAFHAQPVKIAVTCLNKGRKLLDLVRNHPHTDLPFLIVIDQYLPDIDSLELLNELKAHQHSKLIPVAIMAGFASEDAIRQYYLAGANCFYKKPMDIPDWSHMADCLITLFYNKY